jgi:hypothetical protein
MTSQIDIYESAKALIEQYGDEASLIAKMRAEALSGRGDVEGATTGLGVMRAIKVIMAKTLSPNDTDSS